MVIVLMPHRILASSWICGASYIMIAVVLFLSSSAAASVLKSIGSSVNDAILAVVFLLVLLAIIRIILEIIPFIFFSHLTLFTYIFEDWAVKARFNNWGGKKQAASKLGNDWFYGVKRRLGLGSHTPRKSMHFTSFSPSHAERLLLIEAHEVGEEMEPAPLNSKYPFNEFDCVDLIDVKRKEKKEQMSKNSSLRDIVHQKPPNMKKEQNDEVVDVILPDEKREDATPDEEVTNGPRDTPSSNTEYQINASPQHIEDGNDYNEKKELLTAYFNKYAPRKIEKIDKLLTKSNGSVSELRYALELKYGPL
eukprot:Tbor_TRINITY_DN6023_c0_g1::TRINITY_DN6023_c0_g1_i1::g.10320::m.10320